MLLVSTFNQSMLIHGIVRIVGSRALQDKKFKFLLIASYLSEMYQAFKLIRAGALTFPDAAVFAVLPAGVICLLLAHKHEPPKDKKQ